MLQDPDAHEPSRVAPIQSTCGAVAIYSYAHILRLSAANNDLCQLRLSGLKSSTALIRETNAENSTIKRIARRALDEAQAAGEDYLGQTEAAVRALCVARPEVTASEALAVVNLVRRS